MRCLFLLLLTAAAHATANRELQLPEGITKCDDEDNFGNIMIYTESNPMPFCANHGTCRENYTPEKPCDCPRGYAGPHCELLEDEVPECTLQCQNEGRCMVGVVSWEDMFKESVLFSNQYCMCPNGYHGLECEHAPQACGDDLLCFNGGTCVTLYDGGVETHHCDCTSAATDELSFAGEACEYPATTVCSQGLDQNGRHFCVNGGTCKGESHMGCQCVDGFVGPVCEFADMGLEPPDCNLECYNHGICRKGAKDLSVLKKFGIHHRRYLQKAYNDDFEHCVCPAGYAGLQCEYEVDVCPGGDHVCLNGGDCDPRVVGDELRFTCDCTKAKTKLDRFAGDFCEMESTEFCTVDRKKTLAGKGQNAFCTNEGTCKGLVEHGQQHPGCDCPATFFGNQCQYIGADVRVVEGGSDSRKGLVSALTIVMLLMAFGVIFTIYARRKGSNICGPGNDAIETAPAPTIENFQEVDPWNAKDLFDEANLSDDEEVYDDVDLTEQEETEEDENEKDMLPIVNYGNDDFDDENSDRIFDNSFSFGAYEGSSVGEESTTSSVTMDVPEQRPSSPGIEDESVANTEPKDDGPVVLMKTDASEGGAVVLTTSSASSIMSSQSDQLHVFKDSFDGSDKQFV